MLQRNIYDSLKEWKERKSGKKCLVVRGARQVGKTYIVERFGENDICREDLRGTTDMADVSLRIPSVHPWVSLGCPGTALHTEAFARATVSEYSETYLLRCAKALACTAAEVLHS